MFRSHKHIYAQVIDDDTGRTLAAASTGEKSLQDEAAYGGGCVAATVVGRVVAERAIAAGVSRVAYDRGSCKFHGRIAALSAAAREAGLQH
ncbi:unnamed protein product [marine sediment metagenome]|uniref:50S ribosomal protein L18 n=1 Tax=marine sediment metagenome TaxID=412755 RepID=X0TWH5_9ZZZZ